MMGGVWGDINFITDKVKVRVNGRVATVEMNRPEALNALDWI